MKPVVQYVPSPNDSINVGFSAFIVQTLDHPSERVTNTQPVYTSTVLSHDADTGEFETRNSIYKRAKAQ